MEMKMEKCEMRFENKNVPCLCGFDGTLVLSHHNELCKADDFLNIRHYSWFHDLVHRYGKYKGVFAV
jgi:hypothetical protein